MKYIILYFSVIFNINLFAQQSITIVVTVPNESDEVYISGNQPTLGNWQPDTVKMIKISKYEREVTVNVTFPAEFKFLRGSWESEGITDEFYNNENCIIQNERSPSRFEIKYWSDELRSSHYKYDFDIQYLQSDIFDDERIVMVKKPGNYDPDKKYSVVYILDAHSLFETTLLSTQILSKKVINKEGLDFGNDNIPEIIIVGIVHKNRGYETTPNFINNMDIPEHEYLEGSVRLKDFIFKELVPHIDSEYSTSGYNSIIGHSNTGHFVLNLPFQQNNPFKGIVALSVVSEIPEYNERISSFLQTNDSVNIYFGYGDADIGFNELAMNLEEQITKKEWENKYLKIQGFNAGHNQLPGLAIANGLKHLFHSYKNSNEFKALVIEGNLSISEYLEDYIQKHRQYGEIPEINENLIIDFLEYTVKYQNPSVFSEIITYIENNPSIEIQKNLLIYYAKELEDKKTGDIYVRKVVESEDPMDYDLVCYNLKNTYLPYFLQVKKDPEEALNFLEKMITKSEKFQMELSFFYAKIALENKIQQKKAKEHLNFVNKNYRTNYLFTKSELDQLNSK